MKTYHAKPSEVTRKWYVIDAAEAPLGRMATVAATLLLGKHKPMFTRHIDVGDYVIVINAQELKVTGNKAVTKSYHRHSGFPGGLHSRRLEEQMAKDPTRVIVHAIQGMIPANKLRDERLKRLKVYTGSEHQHEAQKPEIYSLKSSKEG